MHMLTTARLDHGSRVVVAEAECHQSPSSSYKNAMLLAFFSNNS